VPHRGAFRQIRRICRPFGAGRGLIGPVLLTIWYAVTSPAPVARAPLAARAAALELLGAYAAELSHAERVACLDRVVGEVGSLDDVRALVQALTEYGATFAEVAAHLQQGGVEPDPARLVRAIARVDLETY
jgi:hypothetical protein